MGMFKGRLLPTRVEVHRMGLGKKKKDGTNFPPPPGLMPLPPPPAPGMPLPPPPAPGMPLPPAPNMAASLPPAPQMSPAAPPPVPTPVAAAPPIAAPPAPLPAIEALPPSVPQTPAVTPVAQSDADSYSGLYAKKSGKPLQQVYGHIERISQGDIGSLLDRYSDRFGHELDRDIIVMRKDEREDKIAVIRDSPTVELLNQVEEDESALEPDTLVELNTQLKTVEDELRRLKPEYQAAKEEGDRELLRELRPSLESLMAERKLLKAVISGETDIDELFKNDNSEDVPEAESAEEYEEEDDQVEGDLFIDFVAIVDALLGNNLSEDAISTFSQSDGFEIFKAVGSSPGDADESERSEFFSVIDKLLGGMPDEAVHGFVESDDFEIYRAIGAMYS